MNERLGERMGDTPEEIYAPRLSHTISFSTVLERDVDFLLLEEISVSPDFRDYLVSKILGSISGYTLIEVAHSVAEQMGETDLQIIVKSADGRKIGLLFENKIDAPFQKDQCERYHERGRRGVDKKWNEYRACLCAPRNRIPADDQAFRGDPAHWDACIALEDIIEWFEQSKSIRSQFKVKFLKEAVRKPVTGGWVRDEAASIFWRSYIEICHSEYPELVLSRVHLESSVHAPWPRFCEGQLPGGVLLEHKPMHGYVDLTLARRSKAEVLDRVNPILPTGSRIHVVRAGASTALRIKVHAIDQWQPFDKQVETVRMALDTVKYFLEFWPTLRGRLGI